MLYNSMKTYVLAVGVCLLVSAAILPAATVPVPNASFEGPLTLFADQRIDSWEDNPKPPWYDELTNGPWDQLTGVFKNTDPGTFNHIHNIDGAQAAFLFNLPQVGIFQDYNSTDWAHPLPSHEFNAIYQVGKAYQLTVGLIGGGGNMTNGSSLGISLYYRDASSNMVTVAFTNVVHSLALFPDTTNFVDIPLSLPVVNPTDPWAGQNIGIAIFTTIGFELAGGYWDLDNVRLLEFERPRLLIRRPNDIVVQSDPGLKFDILATSNLTVPRANWTVIGTVTNTTGTVTFVDPDPGKNQRFYIARQVP